MKRIMILTIWLALIPAAVNCESLRGVPICLNTPEDVVEWFQNDFEYQMTIPDSPQSPQETVDSKRGDCDDFAVLAAEILSRKGIRNDVIIIKFKNLKIRHAVCAMKDSDDTYYIISDQDIYRTGKSDITEAIEALYPDWEKIMYSNRAREVRETISRGDN